MAKQTKEILERNIKIVELRNNHGYSAKEIAEMLGLRLYIVNNTIANYRHRLSLLKERLENYDAENLSNESPKAVNGQTLSIEQLTEIYTHFLEIVYEDGFVNTTARREEVAGIVGLNNADFQEMLMYFENNGYIEKRPARSGLFVDIFQVTEEGTPYAERKVKLEMKLVGENTEEADTQVADEVQKENGAVVETEVIEEESAEEGSIESLAAVEIGKALSQIELEKLELLRELAKEVRRQQLQEEKERRREK